jgi:Zn-dependent protease
MENDQFSFYPPKPFLEKEPQQRGHVAVTVFSLTLFALSLVLFFDNQLLFITEIIAVVLFHELGHFIAMKAFKYENVRMLFLPFMGAFVHGQKTSYKQNESLSVILAGPMPGIALGVVFWLMGFSYQATWMIDVALMLWALNMLNLLPVLPLDGGRLLSTLFFEKMELVQVVFTFISSLVLIGLGWYFEWTVIMIFGFLMGFQVKSQHRRYLIHKGLKEEEVDFNSTYDDLSDRAYYFIKNHVLENSPGLRKLVEQTDEEESKNVVANEVNNLLVPPMIQNCSWFLKLILIVTWIAGFLVPIYFVWDSGMLEGKINW